MKLFQEAVASLMQCNARTDHLKSLPHTHPLPAVANTALFTHILSRMTRSTSYLTDADACFLVYRFALSD
jgi:hypothetical protein